MLSELVTKMLLFNEGRTGLQEPVIWPALLGPSGAGKTTLVRGDVASALSAEVELLNLELQPEHEVAGIPRVVEDEEYGLMTKIIPPEWAIRAMKRARNGQRTIVFLDELDKARDSRLKVALTLLAERRLYHLKFPNHVLFVAAMQQPSAAFFATSTGEALQARLCFLPVTGREAWEIVKSQCNGWSGIDVLMPSSFDIPVPNARYATPRATAWYADLRKRLTSDERRAVLFGIFPHDKASELAEREATGLTPEELLIALKRNPELVDKLTMAEILTIIDDIYISPHVTKEVFTRVIIRFVSESNIEEAIQGTSAMHQRLFDWAEANAVTLPNGERQIEILPDMTGDEVAEVYIAALRKRAQNLGFLDANGRLIEKKEEPA